MSITTWLLLYGAILGCGAGPSEKSLGVIPIHGEVGGGLAGSADPLVPVIGSPCESPLVHTFMLRISSPGSSPAETERIASSLDFCCPTGCASKRKPVVAVIEQVGASAVYTVSMHADEVVASRYALVGSISAVTRSFDASDALNRHGVKERVHASVDL